MFYNNDETINMKFYCIHDKINLVLFLYYDNKGLFILLIGVVILYFIWLVFFFLGVFSFFHCIEVIFPLIEALPSLEENKVALECNIRERTTFG
jgi:hypothetical protein